MQIYLLSHVLRSMYRKRRKNLERASSRTSITLTKSKAGSVCGRANVTLADYNDKHASTEGDIDFANGLQSVCCRRFIYDYNFAILKLVFLRGDDYLNWFLHVRLFFHVKSSRMAEGKQEVAFLQNFKVTPHITEIDGGSHWLYLRWASHSKVDYFANWNTSYFVIARTYRLLGACPFSVIVSVYHRMGAN